MNSFVVAFFCLVAVASATHVGLWGVHPGAHVASGSVSVGANGAVLAGPAGSVRTDNGLHGGGAGANLAGPAGDVRTHGGAVALAGPGAVGHGGVVGGVVGGWGPGVVGLSAGHLGLGVGNLGLGVGHLGLGLGHGVWGGHGLLGHGW